MDPNQFSGFDPRVQEQLSNLSQTQQGRRGSFSSQSTTSQSSYYTTHSTPYQTRGPRNSRGAPHFDRYQAQPPPVSEAFPPLGSQQSRSTNMASQSHTRSHEQYNSSNGQAQRSQSAAQEFFARSRGRGRGRGPRRGDQFHTSQDHNSYSRPSPAQQQLYNPGAHQHYVNSEQREANRQKHMMQSDYLNAVVNRSSANMLTAQEIGQKQAFAGRIEALARGIVSQYHNEAGSPLPRVKLQPYGSLANSFGTAGCDMDLLLTVGSQDNPFMDISEAIKRGLEKALLDQDIGARLLTNTRVPILRICETPDPELLRNLRDQRSRWELAEEEAAAAAANIISSSAPLPQLTTAQEAEQAQAVLGLDQSAAEVTLPDSPPPSHARLEYIGDCGIQCDVNFANHVALYNSKLLWTYGQCDPRVRHVGIFVKNWAKARDINTPYRGTLSSYGYILMILHYLINVAHPPLLPNLQLMAKNDGWDDTPVELVEGHDVRFAKDMNAIKAHMTTMQPNRSTPGALLLGFFRYYGSNSHASFRWIEQAISIRTPGGILTKQDKGWVRAKWSEEQTNVRQRYLLAIEDPFEIEHNVGRTVGHNGVVAIREEFRRAWDMIENVHSVQTPQGRAWAMIQPDGSYDVTAMDLLSTAESRGDLLRKDAENRKLQNENKRQLRKDLERSEEMQKKMTLGDEQLGQDDNGMWQDDGLRPEDDSVEAQETTLLIQNFQHQDSKISRMRSRRPERERVNDLSDDDDDEPDEDDVQEHENQVDGRREEEAPNIGGWSDMMNDAVEINSNTWEYDRNIEQEVNDSTWGDDIPSIQQSTDPNMTGAAKPHVQEPDNRFAASSNAPNANNWNDTSGQENPDQSESFEFDTVDAYIDWTRDSKGGRWLLKRDELIRSGQFYRPSANEYGRLHTAFPYDPEISPQRLAKLNAKLEAWYKNTIYPAFTTDQRPDPYGTTKVEIESDHNTDHATDFTVRKSSNPAASSCEWPVGEDIPWTAENGIGTWLLWRDRKLKAGEEVKSRGWAGIGEKLSQLFPYDPRATLATIEEMNVEISRYFAHVTFPRREMDKRDQYHYTQEILDAIDEVIHERTPNMSSTSRQFDAIYRSQPLEENRQVRFEAPFNSDYKQSLRTKIDAAIPWNANTDAGRWLRKRDLKIEDGSWQDGLLTEGSVFNYVNRLFPYQVDVNPQVRARQNEELEVFGDAILPSKPWEDGEPAIKAILKIVEGRQGDAEADRVRVLIDLFKQQSSNRLWSNISNVDKQQNNDENRQGESRIVGAFSQQLKKNQAPLRDITNTQSQAKPKSTNMNDDREEIRLQRLAYFQKQQSTSDNGKQAKPVSQEAILPQRRDSAAAGPRNNTPSPENRIPTQDTLGAKDRLDSNKNNSESELPISHRTAEVTRSASVSQPRNLYEQRDQCDEPDVIPIVTSSDFNMDPAQLADIEYIKAGGSGCARGGQSPLLLESDQYSWGGAGAMAHKCDSTKDHHDGWASAGPHDDEATKELDNELPLGVDW